MKKFISVFVVLFLLVTFIPALPKQQFANATTYGNVDLDVLVERGVLQGYPDQSLHLERTLTRAEFAKMIVKAFPYDFIPWFNLSKYTFKDTPKDFWASPYIETLARAKVFMGYPDGTFKPNSPITLDEAVLVLSRALKITNPQAENVISNFKDANMLLPEAKDFVNYFVKMEFYKPTGDTLGAGKPITREAFAHMLASSRFPVITILHTNDFHMYLLGSTDKDKKPIGGSARIYTVVKEERAYNPDRTLLVDAGDAIGGGPPIGAFFYGKDVIEVYNAMGYNYATFGNHEFDWGKDVLAERVSEAKYTYICSNVIDTKTNSTFMSKPYDIKSFGFVKLGLFGLENPQLPILVNPNGLQGLEILDPVKTATNVVSILKDNSNFIVLLSHLGYSATDYYTGDIGDVQLASKVNGINLIIGGHTHTVLNKPTIVNGTYIVQTGSYGNNLGEVKLYFEAKADSVRLAKIDYKLIPINGDIKEDEGILSIIKPYNDEVSKKMSEVIGEALVDLDGSRPNIRIKETNLGDFIADWMREISSADIAITNGGGIRASIPKGPISVGTIYTVLPFDNLIVMLDLKGSDVLAALENGYSQVEAQAGRFAQISGIRVKVDLTKKPGSRVVEAKLLDGTPIDPNKVYKVATNDFMAAGGDGYTVFKNALSIKIVTGNYMRDDLVNYIKAHPKVYKEVDGRITFVTP
ncbi:5'-nucleotidase C-terminal domain-containing protein [Caldisericum exile]|uniref:5'-nucleotidase C-terminal domain-containing protein n=1 Tax=Caldisericum exile TaxID=693075 RepID=UPI003C78473E